MFSPVECCLLKFNHVDVDQFYFYVNEMSYRKLHLKDIAYVEYVCIKQCKQYNNSRKHMPV